MKLIYILLKCVEFSHFVSIKNHRANDLGSVWPQMDTLFPKECPTMAKTMFNQFVKMVDMMKIMKIEPNFTNIDQALHAEIVVSCDISWHFRSRRAPIRALFSSTNWTLTRWACTAFACRQSQQIKTGWRSFNACSQERGTCQGKEDTETECAHRIAIADYSSCQYRVDVAKKKEETCT